MRRACPPSEKTLEFLYRGKVFFKARDRTSAAATARRTGLSFGRAYTPELLACLSTDHLQAALFMRRASDTPLNNRSPTCVNPCRKTTYGKPQKVRTYPLTFGHCYR